MPDRRLWVWPAAWYRDPDTGVMKEAWGSSAEFRHVGILSRLRVPRKDCEAMIINARTKAGWFK